MSTASGVARTAPSRGLLLVPAALVAWLPRAARACSSCFLESDLTREAYYGTTILMIAVPLLFAAGIGLWLHQAARARRRGSD